MLSRVINLALSATEISGPSLLHLVRTFNIRKEVISRVLMEEEEERERKKAARRQAKLEREARMEEERLEKKRQRQMKRQATMEARNKIMEEKQKMNEARKQNLLKLQPPHHHQQANHTIEEIKPQVRITEVKKRSQVQNVLVKMSDGRLRHCIRLEDGTIVPIERGQDNQQQTRVMSDIVIHEAKRPRGGNPIQQPSNVPVISLSRKPAQLVRPQMVRPQIVRPQVAASTVSASNHNSQLRYTNGHNPSEAVQRKPYPTFGSVVVRHGNLPHQNPRFVRVPSPVVVGHRPGVIRAYKPLVAPLNLQQRPVLVRPNRLQIVRPNSFYPSQVQKQLYTLAQPITSQQIIRPAYNQSVHHDNNHLSTAHGEAPNLQPFSAHVTHTSAVSFHVHVATTSNNKPPENYTPKQNVSTNEVKVVSSLAMNAAKPQIVSLNSSSST